jgi:dolichyl-phosphate-mannose-protein mannosyltransferase
METDVPPKNGPLARLSLLKLLLLGLGIRLLVAWVCPGFGPDMLLYKAWTLRIVRSGPSSLLDPAWASAPAGTLSPLHVFLLGGLGWLWQWIDPLFAYWRSNSFNLLVRLPTILADVAAMIGIYRIALLQFPAEKVLARTAMFCFSPPLILVSAVWGSPEAILVALLIWGTCFLMEGNEFLGILLLACSALVHVPAVLFLPLGLIVALQRKKVGATALALGLTLVVAQLLGWSLSPRSPLEPYVQQLHHSPFTCVNAFNVWFPVGHLQSDKDGALGLAVVSRRALGAAIFLTFYLLALMKVWERESESVLIREMALAGLAYFLFLTRVHERYLLYPLAFILLLPGGRRSFNWFSLSLFLNLLWVLGLSSFTEMAPSAPSSFIFRWILGFPKAWGTAADQGWGNCLAVFNLLVFVRLAFWPLEPAADDDDGLAAPAELTEAQETRQRIVRLDRLDLVLILLITLLFGYLRFHNLATPPDFDFDEVYHAKAGDEIWRGKAPNEWVHPPLAKLIIGLGIKCYEMNSFGWRFMPWLAGCFVLPILYVLARNIQEDRRAALIATILFGLDGCFFVLSRTAMTNIFAVTFQLATLTALLLYLKQASQPGGRMGHGWCMLATSLMVSLGVSTRWTCIWMLGAVAALYGIHCTWIVFVRDRGKFTPEEQGLRYAGATLSGITLFIMVPVGIYLLSYLPLVRWKCYPDYKYVVALQPQIWHFHTTFTTHHPYYSQWFSWIFTHRPVWYHYRDNAGLISGIVALGNPLLWWLSLPGIIMATWWAWRRKDWLVLYACGAWAVLYLPWGLSPRVLNYSHYYLEPLPYACIAMAWLITRYLELEDSSWGEVIVAICIIAACFAFFYPLYSATPLPRKSYELRLWTRNWI